MKFDRSKCGLVIATLATILMVSGCSLVPLLIDKPKPIGEPTRLEVIDKYLKGKMTNDIHGIWITAHDEYDVAIIKNTFGIYPGYQHIGIIVGSRSPVWHVGETKLLLKETAEPHVFIVKYYMGDKTEQGSTAVQLNANLVTFKGIQNGFHFIRSYPENSKSAAGQSKPGQTAGSGTGFFVRPNLIATNHHVVVGASKIMVHHNGRKYSGEVALQDQSNDLALVRINMNPGAPLALGKAGIVRQGQKVYTIGYPLSSALGKQARVSEGIVNSTVGVQDDPRMLQISVPVQPGNSGGPLFDTNGDVVGIVTAGLGTKYFEHTGTMAQNVNFAVKIEYLTQLLNMLPGGSPSGRTNKSEAGTADSLFGWAKNSVVYIEVTE